MCNRTIIIFMFCVIILWTDVYCYLLCIAWAVFTNVFALRYTAVLNTMCVDPNSTHTTFNPLIVASFNGSSSFRQIPHMVTSEFKSLFLIFSWSSSPGFRKVIFSCDLGFLVEWNVICFSLIAFGDIDLTTCRLTWTGFSVNALIIPIAEFRCLIAPSSASICYILKLGIISYVLY